MTMITVKTCPCPKCGDTKLFTVDKAKLLAWQNRELFVQDAFPDLSADDRERFMTGMCPTCWDDMWNKDNEG